MRYMLLIYQDEHVLDDVAREACYVKSGALAHDLHQAGKFRGASPLQSIATATSVQMRGGKRFVTDGPWRGPVGQARARLQQELEERWAPYIRREMNKVDAAQALIDTPEEYARVAESCGGEVKRLTR